MIIAKHKTLKAWHNLDSFSSKNNFDRIPTTIMHASKTKIVDRLKGSYMAMQEVLLSS